MPDPDFTGARGVLHRVIGPEANRFVFEKLDSNDGLDSVEVEARNGAVSLRASSPIAICRGAYRYLRERCNRQFSWSGGAIQVPSPLPDSPLIRLESRVQNRHYLSVCTHSYSTCWWDWERWERELDWMAMHGINQPLLLTGQEAVSRRVFLKLGLTESEIAAHFSGPAYLCWHRLGNLNGYMGLLPRSWLEVQEQLQGKILDRARELGMRPIVPGFSGFVPAALRRVRPDTALMSAEPWAGFEQTTYLDPRSETFREVGQLFLQEYRRAYGVAHHYLCELFAEQVPRLDPANELEDLRAIGRAIWETLENADPEATWVMQGWPFYFARDFWQPEKTGTLLDAAPPGRTMVLDLATEELETWRLQPAMREKGWMFNVVHNYGQNTHLHGHLEGFIQRAESMLRDPLRGRLQGMGISPEGIDQNPVVYELLTDLAWTSGAPNLEVWVQHYAQSRYGQANPDAGRAWTLLSKSIYGPESMPHPRYSWRFRPGDQPLVGSPSPTTVKEALEALLAASSAFEASSNYRRDVVDVAKTWLGAIVDRLLEQALETQDTGSFFEALADMDRLLATRPEHRLSTWLESAKQRASDPAEARLYERNARALITHWGGPFLFDYAIRDWAGLTADFQVERWRRWFDRLNDKQHAPDFASWELEWAESTRAPKESPPGPEIETARNLLAKYHQTQFAPDPPLQVHRLEPRPMQGGTLTIDLPAPKTLVAVACCPIFGQGLKARYSMELSGGGHNWESVPSYFGAEEPCRGMRFRFERSPISSLRFRIEVVQGSSDQLFQVTLFELA